MSLLDSLKYRWRVLTRPRTHETELAEEVDFHVGLETMQRGHASRGALPPGDARNAARRRFGNSTYYREETRRVSGLGFFDVLSQDARFALRSFGRTPTFTAVAVATLAIGIGANTAIFSAVDALLLRPLPFAEPDRLMSISLTVPPRGDRPARSDVLWSHPKFAVFREGQTVFSGAALWLSSQFTMRINDDAVRVAGDMVDAQFFSTLGVRPALGRTFSRDDDRIGATRAVVISDEFWQRQFNADPTVLGSSVDIDGAAFTIIGVAPPSFSGLSGRVSFWIPILAAPPSWPVRTITDPGFHSYFAIGRLAPGVSYARATAMTGELGTRVDAAFPDNNVRTAHWGATAKPLDATRVDGDTRDTLLILLGAVGLVLLVACANVANLFLARASGRRREIAVRLAIGAGRGRLIRQLLVESVLLALMGGIASLAVAWVALHVIVVAQPGNPLGWQSSSGINTGSMQPIQLDVVALAFTGALAIVTGILFGLVPALQSTHPSLSDALKADGGASGDDDARRRFSVRDALTIGEIALAVILLAGSGVLVRSFAQLVGVRPGFDATNVLTLRVNRAPAWSRDSIGRFYDVALARIAQLPGVTGVALGDCPPISGGCSPQEALFLRDRPPAQAGGEPVAGIHWITPTWQTVLRVPLVRGRFFNSADRPGAPHAVLVNEAAARALWPGQNPIGRAIFSGANSNDTLYVVGVVGDVRHRWLGSPPRPDVYLPYHQQPLSARMMLFVRTSGDPAALANPVRLALKEVAPGFPVYDVATMEERVGGSTASARFSATLLGMFATLALALATMGAYGVISFAVAQRTREIGVRVALGATAGNIVGMVVKQGMALVVIGGAIGLAGALATTRLLRSQLYGVEPTDPVTLVTIVLLLAVAVLAASWIPAQRAASIPAVQALRGG